MKRIHSIVIFMTLLLGVGFNASALKVTLQWDIPGSVELIAEDPTKHDIALTPGQTSFVWETEQSYGYIYAYAADGYRLVGAATADGTKKYNPAGTPPRLSMGFFSSDDGITVKITTAKLDRNDSFTVDVVNGLSNILSAEFNSGYTLPLQKGSHSYNFNAEYDDPLTITLQAVESAYSITLNGTDIPKNRYFARYDDIKVENGDKLVIQVYESDDLEPKDCTFTVEYGANMEGCISNIRNAGANKWYYPEDFEGKSIDVLENTTLRVNFNTEDYTISKLTLNGGDVTKDMVTSSFDGSQFIELSITDTSNIFKVEGTAKEYGIIDFTGYITNAEGVCFSKSYHGTPFDIGEGEKISEDITLSSSVIMPASDTMKYIIPASEKSPKFFFYPKEGYYISNVYTKTPEGRIERHSGNASFTAAIDGTTFYMIVEKLAEPYTASMKITGDAFRLKIQASSAEANSWDNPAPPVYSSVEGEQEISFIPGFGTPIIFACSSSEDGTPALYLDGAEVEGKENSESGGIDFSVTPYYPAASDDNSEIHSTIEVYNSITQRPTMSGASLECEEGYEAEFFYSQVLRPADPKGQPVISGTLFTVRPAHPSYTVSYKGEEVALDEKGEFVFEAKGNARNNVVKVSAPKDPSSITAIEGKQPRAFTVISIDGRVIFENAPSSSLEDLEKGIYIINGEKQVVR